MTADVPPQPDRVSSRSANEKVATDQRQSARPSPSGRAPTSRQNRRDRRGRGLRRPLFAAGLPNARSRAQQFDLAVLQAVGDLEAEWAEALTAIEFAVDEVPPLPAGDVMPSSDVVLDGGVPLTRFVPPGLDRRGRPTRARIVIYRRPLESRAVDAADLADLVVEVMREQVSAVLGEPDEPGAPTD
jgi:hypothetical protein